MRTTCTRHYYLRVMTFSFLKSTFLIWLLIIPFTFTNPTHEELDEFKKEIADFRTMWRNILNSTIPHEEKLILGGSLQNKFEEALKRGMKVDTLGQLKLKLELEKERSDLYRVLLGISHRVDHLEEIFAAEANITLPRSRYDRWIKILKQKTPIISKFCSKIIEGGLTMEVFAKSVQHVCQERNERAGHGDVSLPEVLKENNINKLLKLLKIPKDEYSKRTIEILIAPVEVPKPSTATT